MLRSGCILLSTTLRPLGGFDVDVGERGWSGVTPSLQSSSEKDGVAVNREREC